MTPGIWNDISEDAAPSSVPDQTLLLDGRVSHKSIQPDMVQDEDGRSTVSSTTNISIGIEVLVTVY